MIQRFLGVRGVMDIPQINAAVGSLPGLSMDEAELVRAYYAGDLQL